MHFVTFFFLFLSKYNALGVHDQDDLHEIEMFIYINISSANRVYICDRYYKQTL